MSESSSESFSWSRDYVLWTQVASMLSLGNVPDKIIENVRVELFVPQHLETVGVSAIADEFRVRKWVLQIDWEEHTALLETHRLVDRHGGFREDGESHAIHGLVQMVNEFFDEHPDHGRGWMFSTDIEFADACERIGVGSGRTLKDHPRLRRQGRLALPGLGEASIAIFGLEDE